MHIVLSNADGSMVMDKVDCCDAMCRTSVCYQAPNHWMTGLEQYVFKSLALVILLTRSRAAL